MNRKLREDEIDTLIEYIRDYVLALVVNHNSEHVEDMLFLSRQQTNLKNHLIELVGEKTNE